MMQKLGYLGAAIAVIFGVYFLAGALKMTPERFEQQLLDAAPSVQVEMIGVAKETFPQEYAQFMNEATDLYNEGAFDSGPPGQKSFAFSQGFFANLRIENAPYLATAPFEYIRDIRAGSTAVLEDLSDRPALCAIFALQGAGGFSLEQLSQLDIDLLVHLTILTFKAMAAGRDTPVDHVEATQSEINDVIERWRAQSDVDTNDWLALMSANLDDPRTCAANLSFERFLLQQDDPLVQRVLVHLTVLSHQI